ncbi:sensor histidine kinase [Rhodobacter maris]|uniref:histidine kinase n=1 Tax=Rhodobacter maris TaxID=446682 RepID=A0A285S2W7_9RHOB|nr:histidine kinase dimerization/phosphoacceptor domain -containing protein [Rhodobacter maris]SOB99250.1 two-component sensor histidine kinase [Rhodobacter maris]
MKLLRAMTVTPHGSLFEWGGSAAIFALALGLRFETEGLLPPGYPFLTFFPAVFLTGFFVSTRAGVVMAVGCGLAAWFFFVTPEGTFRLGGPGLLAMGFYAFIVATELFVIAAMRAALGKLQNERADWARQAQQNTLMFHELQHRVSNNLQVIGSILRMEERKARDPVAKKALNTAAARLGVIASLQRQLHDPRRQVTEIGALMQSALPEIVAAANLSQRVRLAYDLVPLAIPADQATPVALIVVEMVSNALEHALRETGRTTITLRTRLKDGIATIAIEDNGTGLPEDFDPGQPKSLGLRLATQFAAQLEGTLGFDARDGGGTVVTLTFPPKPADPAAA